MRWLKRETRVDCVEIQVASQGQSQDPFRITFSLATWVQELDTYLQNVRR